MDFAVTRLNRDGSLDATFGTGGKQTVGFDLGGINEDRATAVAVQADGKVVAGDSANRGGVRLAVKDLDGDGDGRADLVVGSGPGGGVAGDGLRGQGGGDERHAARAVRVRRPARVRRRRLRRVGPAAPRRGYRRARRKPTSVNTLPNSMATW